ncbi:50S ribosomal protein L19e [Candidatus Woesearchaeota archaeon]|nr:50S ribosomal protein L19e [Candidatus Woesearchaeota archaeon]
MKFNLQKRLAADILKCSESRIIFNQDRLEDIKEAITKLDIKSLINDKAIKEKPKKGNSRFRARKIKIQKRKGKRKGPGSKKGKKTSRLSKKKSWMNKIRKQRAFLKNLRDKEIITKENYHTLYQKAKGGFFRSKRHIKLYLEEHKLAKKPKEK